MQTERSLATPARASTRMTSTACRRRTARPTYRPTSPVNTGRPTPACATCPPTRTSATPARGSRKPLIRVVPEFRGLSERLVLELLQAQLQQGVAELQREVRPQLRWQPADEVVRFPDLDSPRLQP